MSNPSSTIEVRGSETNDGGGILGIRGCSSNVINTRKKGRCVLFGSTSNPPPNHPPDSQLDYDFDDTCNDDDETLRTLHTTVPDMHLVVSNVGSCSSKTHLDPKGIWFKHSRVSRGISTVIRQHYNDAWFSWSKTPQHVKDQWYCAFKEKYTWNPAIEKEAYEGFNEGGSGRLKDLRYKAQKRNDDDPPKWMSMETFKRMKQKALDPNFIQRSKCAKTNRKSGLDGGTFQSRHCIGSMSFQDLAERMAKENNGVLPSAPQLYVRAHTKTTSGKTVFCGKKAKETVGKFKEQQQLYDSQSVGKNSNEVFYEAVGGRKKGKVPGLGNSAELFFKKSLCTSTAITSYEPSIVSILEEKLTQQKQERERVTEELDYQRSKTTYLEEQYRQQKEQISLMKKQFETFSQLMHQRGNSVFTLTQFRDPDDPSSEEPIAAKFVLTDFVKDA